MAQTRIICIGCPKGCAVTVTHEGTTIQNIEGFGCENGRTYARNEFTAPVRIFTSTVRVEGGSSALVPVKTAGSVPKNMLMECAKESCRITASVAGCSAATAARTSTMMSASHNRTSFFLTLAATGFLLYRCSSIVSSFASSTEVWLLRSPMLPLFSSTCHERSR